jgi:hypothetical protein
MWSSTSICGMPSGSGRGENYVVGWMGFGSANPVYRGGQKVGQRDEHRGRHGARAGQLRPVDHEQSCASDRLDGRLELDQSCPRERRCNLPTSPEHAVKSMVSASRTAWSVAVKLEQDQVAAIQRWQSSRGPIALRYHDHKLCNDQVPLSTRSPGG